MPIVPVDLGAREQFSDAYGAINPRRVVPTLMLDDGTAIGEVPAILCYLEETYPEPPLLGATPKTRALVAMWERRVELEGFASVMEAVRNAVPGLVIGPSPDRMIMSRSLHWLSATSSASGISMPTSMPGSPMLRLWRVMSSRSPTLPLLSPSTSQPSRPDFRWRRSTWR